MNQDFLDMLAALLEAGVRFLVVGAHAMAVHGVPRATADLDIWLDTAPDNVGSAWRAIVTFGVPVEALGVTEKTLATKGRVVQLGLPLARTFPFQPNHSALYAEKGEDRKADDSYEVIAVTGPSKTESIQQSPLSVTAISARRGPGVTNSPTAEQSRTACVAR